MYGTVSSRLSPPGSLPHYALRRFDRSVAAGDDGVVAGGGGGGDEMGGRGLTVSGISRPATGGSRSPLLCLRFAPECCRCAPVQRVVLTVVLCTLLFVCTSCLYSCRSGSVLLHLGRSPGFPVLLCFADMNSDDFARTHDSF